MEELAEAVGMTLEETERIMKTWKHPVSLDTPVGESEDASFGDFLEDDNETNPAESAMQEMLRDKIEVVLRSLTYQQREIIQAWVIWLKYGQRSAIPWKKRAASSKSRENEFARSNRRLCASCSTKPVPLTCVDSSTRLTTSCPRHRPRVIRQSRKRKNCTPSPVEIV